MRIACPDCTAEYEVPVERMAPGRNVRCAKCGTKWSPLPALPPPAPAPVIEAAPPTPEPADIPLPPAEPDVLPEEPPAPSEPAKPARKGKLLLALAWLTSFAVLGAAGYAAVKYRTAVIQAWPPSARAYLWLGLAR